MLCVEGLIGLSIRLPLVFGIEPWGTFDGPGLIRTLGYILALLVIPLAIAAAWRLVREVRRERAGASRTSRLMDTVLSTSREWLWAIGPDGRFTFSGPAGKDLIGYEPTELVGRPFSVVIEPAAVADALRARKSREGADAAWSGLVTVCRHRDGRRIPVEVSGRALYDGDGRNHGFEGTTRPLGAGAARDLASKEVKARVQGMLASQNLVTAFQPIRSMETGDVIGAEALSRFASSPGLSPESWFVEAASVGLGRDLEILATQIALTAAAGLPPHLYVAVNLSPGACLESRVTEIFRASEIPLARILLEVTERAAVADYGPLAAALDPLRREGLRIAVDDAGAGFASMRHILQLKPDLIKLDQKIIAGIDADAGQRALGAAMVGFAKEIGAAVVAEGIETEAELSVVRRLGMDAGQGYLLGRPSVRPDEWSHWTTAHDRSAGYLLF